MKTITPQTLLAASLLADVLDLFVVGQIPGLSWFIDIPIIAMHVAYSGPAGLTTLLELIPGIGTLPVFTMMAIKHRKHH